MWDILKFGSPVYKSKTQNACSAERSCREDVLSGKLSPADTLRGKRSYAGGFTGHLARVLYTN
jgi:hypothetical protein